MTYPYRPLTSFDFSTPIPLDNPFDALAEPETRIRYNADDLKALRATVLKPTPEQQEAIDRINQAIEKSKALSAQAVAHKGKHSRHTHWDGPKRPYYSHQSHAPKQQWVARRKETPPGDGNKRPYSNYSHQSHAAKHQKIEQWFASRKKMLPTNK